MFREIMVKDPNLLLNAEHKKHIWDIEGNTRLLPHEFPKGTLKWLHYRTIKELILLRLELPGNAYMYPSPLKRAHVRHDEKVLIGIDSQHSTINKTRLSVATDVFVEPSYWYDYLMSGIKRFDGVGIYLDNFITLRGNRMNYPMFHFDKRIDGFLFWVHVDGQYFYRKEGLKMLYKAVDKWG